MNKVLPILGSCVSTVTQAHSPVWYSRTAAMYTGAPTPILYLGWPFLMYRSIRPTGKMTPALADREVLVDFFFPPRLDMAVALEMDQQVHCGGKRMLGSGLLGTSPLSPHPLGPGRNRLCWQMPPPSRGALRAQFLHSTHVLQPWKKEWLSFSHFIP